MADKPTSAKRATRTRPKAEIVRSVTPAPDEKAAAESPQGALAFIERARDVLTVRRVFGDPIERDGVTIIPAAKVRGGGGGGGGEGPDGRGSGGGFGVSATPAGAYVIKNGTVRWEPALDLGRTIFMGQIVGIVFLLTLRSIVKTIAKRR
jgi:uncharacterized spore protein YtfJ